MSCLGDKIRSEFARLNRADEIPMIVRLLENPDSFCALPGKIYLYNHDCLHILLEQNTSIEGEAFVIGFCMGNDLRTTWIHIAIFKFFSCYLYPPKYRFNSQCLIDFDLGFIYGKNLKLKNINQLNFLNYSNYFIEDIQSILTINKSDINLMKREIKFKKQAIYNRQARHYKRLAVFLRWSSSLFGVIGGFILALNIKISPYGFIFLGGSSSQLLISSLLIKDKSLIVYSSSIFIFVDLLGVYRWLIS